ncbi:DUF4174 domain-containing protein [Flagellimonas allohymeniacidonis]|uniref:DUF4174 domain-containing protein n=1 Tax=Flagellimonas allohymeniacidonis TaxID=2517819 RepID=A0A4Q8QE68_9FLAO|nr:DUF4174 domain-containing protein [Allomuricauda hymeniacidonis]TAI46773.1 DUF4174 domain-containing protein [Allomuricauda hymeniacidonis]
MKRFPVLMIFMFMLTSHAQEGMLKYRWKKRLVVLVSKDFNDSIPKVQLDLLDQEKERMKDRDMLVLRTSAKSEALGEFSISNNFEGVLLIGKDGGIKARYPFIVEPSKLFEIVDGMPMRKAEMRRKKGN